MGKSKLGLKRISEQTTVYLKLWLEFLDLLSFTFRDERSLKNQQECIRSCLASATAKRVDSREDFAE
jgi:hypothetical protein